MHLDGLYLLNLLNILSACVRMLNYSMSTQAQTTAGQSGPPHPSIEKRQ